MSAEPPTPALPRRRTALFTVVFFLLVGLAFSGFMIPDLLLPNPFMPWPVRVAHIVEVGVSNTVFGVIAAWLLLRLPPRRMARFA